LDLLFKVLTEIFRFFLVKKSIETEVKTKELQERASDLSDVLEDYRDVSLYSTDGLRELARREGRIVPKIRSVRVAPENGLAPDGRRDGTDIQHGGTE